MIQEREAKQLSVYLWTQLDNLPHGFQSPEEIRDSLVDFQDLEDKCAITNPYNGEDKRRLDIWINTKGLIKIPKEHFKDHEKELIK